ncbi:hypothetical protein CRYUN_Cryun08bG0028500 [Craigia yunnanensis]
MTTVRREALKPADHIYTACGEGLYHHHGIFVGKAKVTNPQNNGEQREIDDAVIHLLGFNKKRNKKTGHKPQCERCFYMSQIVGVIITCLDCFLADSLYVYEYNVSYWTSLFKRNGTCSTWASKPPDQVIQTAFSILEKKLTFGEYSFFFNNCEDFATFCKTGRAMSNQVAWFFSLPGAIVYNVIKDLFYRD